MTVRLWIIGDRAPLDFVVDELFLHAEADDATVREQEILTATARGVKVLFVNPAAIAALEASP